MKRVLIVDDDMELCELVTKYLKREGQEADSVHAGEEGVEQAQNGDYAVVVLDVMLPGIGGFEVLQRLRSGPSSHLPVVMLTARGDEVDRVLDLELGADDYLPKPFSSRELVARIRAILRRTVAPNAVAPNAVASNAVASNAVASNAVASNATISNEIESMTTPVGRAVPERLRVCLKSCVASCRDDRRASFHPPQG